ncbi:MAG TPA: PAS domain S-box protein, partial [Kofleriaceae bacterium]|nr:PAS domain S-box protein [Kofleriaceae bacterium]
GYTRDELIGMRPHEFDVDMTLERSQALVQRLQAGELVTFDGRHRRKDGTLFPVEVRVQRFTVEGHVLSVALARDMTAREVASQQLRASEERFREIAETISDVFWILDHRARQVVYVSPAYERIWGRSASSLYEDSRSWLDAIHPEDRERVREASGAIDIDGAYDEEYRIVRPDGTSRWIRDTGFPVRDELGRVARVIGVARDITQRRELEDRLFHAQKMDAIGRLAGGIAHDFNNIVGTITMEAELALELDPPAASRESLVEIRSAAGRAAALTRQLLMFSRRQVMHLQRLDLNTLVISLARMLQRIIGENIGLQLHLSPTPLPVRGDASMLDQIIVNLAINARDAMPSGGTLTIETAVPSTRTARGPGAPDGRYACLRVIDSGTGIAPEVIPRIFEPFYTTKPRGEGTGLGLAIVFGVVNQHAGYLSVDSQLGRGATFEVFLPLVDDDAPLAESDGAVARGRGETILLVEDEEPFRRATRRLLERHGYYVVVAENADEALRVWQALGPDVALLLTDLVMPGAMGGEALAERVRAEKPDVKIVFTSGYTARRSDIVAPENFVQKPFASSELLATIRRTLDS